MFQSPLLFSFAPELDNGTSGFYIQHRLKRIHWNTPILTQSVFWENVLICCWPWRNFFFLVCTLSVGFRLCLLYLLLMAKTPPKEDCPRSDYTASGVEGPALENEESYALPLWHEVVTPDSIPSTGSNWSVCKLLLLRILGIIKMFTKTLNCTKNVNIDVQCTQFPNSSA